METPEDIVDRPGDSAPNGHDTTLNAAQRDVIDVLGASRDERPVFSFDLRARLHDELAESLAPVIGDVDPDEPLFVNKHRLTMVHGCEARHVYEEATDDFDWTIPRARGTVVHKAVELTINWRGNPNPMDLTDEAMAKIAGDDWSLSVWLRELDEADRAQLRSDVNDQVAAFMECFPPLKRQWRPVTESKSRVELLGSRAVLSGKVDLTLGHATGQRAGKVVIDLKTGKPRPEHRDDLRFYALLETLKIGTPPRLTASYYLDQGRFIEEPVTEDVLDAAIGRTVAGITRIRELQAPTATPVKRPSTSCSWCPLLEDCHEGKALLQGDDDW